MYAAGSVFQLILLKEWGWGRLYQFDTTGSYIITQSISSHIPQSDPETQNADNDRLPAG